MSELLLFEKWSMDDVQIDDLGLQKYINLRPIIIPHSGGRHSSQRFSKTKLNIVERFTNKLMRPGKNAGKKMMVTNAVEAAFELIYLKTQTNPTQVLVDAVVNAAPREETTRVSYGGVAQHQAVDVAPLRRIDLSLRFLTEGILSSSFSSLRTFPESIADELITASRNETSSAGVKKKQELERVAFSAR
uniref:Putative 30S ribosomal protein S7 n=1 Tax=uncultured organism TaxID=155900 RepID=A0A0F6PZT5_9ZZZZ|nr:putative 30S ribosomal protein S7 [uncultured organism]